MAAPKYSNPNRAVRAGAGRGIQFDYVSEEVLKAARRAEGTFTSAQHLGKRAHAIMAENAAKLISKRLADQIAKTGRQQRGSASNSLVSLLKHRDNRDATNSGFVVGVKGFLESSQAAPYFRNLEEGTSIFVGRELQGFFRSAEGRTYGPSRTRRSDVRLFQTGGYFLGKATVTNPDGSKTQFDSRTARAGSAAGSYAQKHGEVGRKRLADAGFPRFRIRIRRPIPAYGFYRFGGLEWLASGDEKKVYAQVLAPTGVKIT